MFYIRKIIVLFNLYLINTIIFLLISAIWRQYELNVFGELKPDPFDTVITLVLTSSLMANIMLIIRVKKFIKERVIINLILDEAIEELHKKKKEQ